MSKVTYENPPLNELVFGIQFNSNIASQHIYKYYGKFLAEEFSDIQERDLLPATIEKVAAASEINVRRDMVTRKMFLNKSSDTVVQIQPDKFLVNWRKGTGTYPHFEHVFSLFKKYLHNLYELDSNLNNSVNQYEITYVDHLEINSFTDHAYNLNEAFTFFTLKRPLKTGTFMFSIPQESVNGVLHVTIALGNRTHDKKPIVSFTTTCRGFDPSQNLDNWFSAARTILVSFFNEVTTDEVKKLWQPKQS